MLQSGKEEPWRLVVVVVVTMVEMELFEEWM
jgi:hypothetical protein